jgi:hypothetical protein
MMAEILLCTICRFPMETDDIAVWGKHVICLRCYARESGTAKPMSKELRRDILDALSEEKP